MAAELHSLVAICMRKPTFKDECQAAGVNGSLLGAPAGEQQHSSIKKPVLSAAMNDQPSLSVKERSTRPLGEARMGSRRIFELFLAKIPSKGTLKRLESPESPVIGIRRPPKWQRASQASPPAPPPPPIGSLDEVSEESPLQWPLPPKDRQEHCDGFRELDDSSIRLKSMS